MKIDVSAVLAGLLVPALAAAQAAPPAPSPAPAAPAPTPPPAADEAPPPLLTPSAAAVSPATPASPAPATSPGTSVASTPEAAPAAGDRKPSVRLGGELTLLPTGTLTVQGPGSPKSSFDSEPTLGVGGVLQIPLNDIFTIDVTPRVVFNVKSKNDTDSATELDLRARVTAGGNVAPSARLYAALQPGYSFLFLPIDAPAGAQMSTPSGLTLGLAAGAAFRVAPGVHITSEVGYQFGFQSSTISSGSQSVDIDVTSSFFHLAGGVLLDL